MAPPSALDYFASLVAEDAGFPLLEAAIAVGQIDEPGLDVQAVLASLDQLALRLKQRLPADAGAVQRLRQLNHFFFDELGFAGNVNDYRARDNSLIHRVLATRRGLPITLALLYIELAEAAGLGAAGIAFPGHYLVKVHLPQGEVVVDAFAGRSLSREDLDERLLPFKRQRGLVDDMDMPLGLFLQAATPRASLARLLRNLKELCRDEADPSGLLAVQERLVRLLPDEAAERRDRGLARAELGDAEGAAQDLRDYLAREPGAADAETLRSRLGRLGGARRPLHGPGV